MLSTHAPHSASLSAFAAFLLLSFSGHAAYFAFLLSRSTLDCLHVFGFLFCLNARLPLFFVVFGDARFMCCGSHGEYAFKPNICLSIWACVQVCRGYVYFSGCNG